jgi:3-hydroxy-9,10-secoandrosta-1,3,5(10)-triene-9,17-dione monooxygenase reductase component
MNEIEPRALRTAFGRFATGVTVVTARRPGGKPEGMTANSFASVSLEPPLLLWSIREQAASRPAFDSATHFAVHVLRASQRPLAERFARPAADKFADLDWEPGLGGAPLLAGCLARFQCAVAARHPGGDHTILVGRVLAVEEAGPGEPLLYVHGGFARLAAGPAAAAA